jgi:ribonuclease HI
MEIFCDGSCLHNPGPGGWAFVCIADDGQITQYNGHVSQTTNNKMELTAAIKSLEKIKHERHTDKVNIYCDSQYVIKGIESWITSWKKNNWQSSTKKPVKNKDLWLQLDKLNNDLNINWKWVKAHAGNKYNEIADSLAREAASKGTTSNV